MGKGTGQFCRSAGRCGAMRRGVHAGMPLGCPVHAAPHGHAAKARACSRQGQGSPHGQAAKARACSRRSQGQGHGRAAKAKACSQALGSQGQGVLQRPRQPPWACCQGQRMHKPRSQGMHKPRSQGQGSPHGQAAKAKARSEGHGMLAWARWHAPGGRQQGPWGRPSMHAA